VEVSRDTGRGRECVLRRLTELEVRAVEMIYVEGRAGQKIEPREAKA
jgi:hypothetical protein